MKPAIIGVSVLVLLGMVAAKLASKQVQPCAG